MTVTRCQSFNECGQSPAPRRPIAHILMEPTEASGEETPPETPAPRACRSWPTSQPLGLPDPNDPPWPVRKRGRPEQTSPGAETSPALPQSPHLWNGNQNTHTSQTHSEEKTRPVRPGLSTFCLYKNSFWGPARCEMPPAPSLTRQSTQ